MLHIKSIEEGLDLFKTLGSDVRINIIKLLLKNKNMNMNELASSLSITNGALTNHMKKLEESGLVTVSSDHVGHGNEKRCSITIDKILIDVAAPQEPENIYQTEVKVGHFFNFSVTPTCGLSSFDSLIGEVDDARYFAHPDRYSADILWFTSGFVEYNIPHFIPSFQKINQLSISMEIGSEAPGVKDDWPSDIHFYLNDIFVGKWTSPGDFGAVNGLLNPDWWDPFFNQYGLLKSLVVNDKGTFIDGLKISDVTIKDFSFSQKSCIRFKIGVPEDAEYVGGLTIFGKHFGNYNQDINVRIGYSPTEKENN